MELGDGTFVNELDLDEVMGSETPSPISVLIKRGSETKALILSPSLENMRRMSINKEESPLQESNLLAL